MIDQYISIFKVISLETLGIFSYIKRGGLMDNELEKALKQLNNLYKDRDQLNWNRELANWHKKIDIILYFIAVVVSVVMFVAVAIAVQVLLK